MKRLIVTLVVGLVVPTAVLAAETYGPYRAEVVRVIDGDTVAVAVHVWPGLVQHTRLRLAGVDAPETDASTACERELAEKAASFTRDFLAGVAVVMINDVSVGKYGGRVLGRITVAGRDLGEALLAAGLARPYAGGKRGDWC